MNKEVKIVHVAHKSAGLPDKKAVGRQLITWLRRDYRLVSRVEVTGESDIPGYTALTFTQNA